MNLQDFFIVFLRDHHHPLNEELAVNKHVDLLSTLKGRLVLSLLITSFIMFPFLAALDKGTYFIFFGNSETDARDSLVYSYTRSFNAFAAKLSTDEVSMLSSMKKRKKKTVFFKKLLVNLSENVLNKENN